MTSLLLLKSKFISNSLQKKKKKVKHKPSMLAQQKSNQKFILINSCRICGDENGEIPIFNNINHPNIPDEIKTISGVTMEELDYLPKNMCQNCLDLLNGCILFRDMCQKSNNEISEFKVKTECESLEDSAGQPPSAVSDDDSYNAPSPEPCDFEASYYTNYQNCENYDNSENLLKPPALTSSELTKKKFLCDICGKTAVSNASLIIHMGIHENVFPFKCDVCPYRGRTMDLLRVHKRSHMTDKPFKCSQCSKTTTTSSNLAKHMRHVHSTTRPHKCSYCEKAFSYQHDMKRHIRDIHLRQGTVECDICYKKFNTKKILQGHRWKIHKIKGERHGRLPSYLQCQIEPEENKKGMEPDFILGQ